MIKIDRETKIFALIDDSPTSSHRPQIFQKLFSQLKTNSSYTPLNIGKDYLNFTINGLRKSQISGVNLGRKYQKRAIGLVDSLSEEAKSCQYITSISIENGKLHGYITTGKAISTLIPGKTAIFGDDINLMKSILWHLEDISSITIVLDNIENSKPLLEKYPNLDIRFGDSNHPFDVDGYSQVVDLSDGEQLYIRDGDFSLITPLSYEVEELECKIDIRQWLGISF